MHTLYPELKPFAMDVLELDDGHSVYFEQSGNNTGLPIIFFHGGPGSGCNENHRRYFNPDKYRIIIFDQRACKRSKPNGCVEHNSTQDILNDVELIRNKLNIEKMLLFGGSWGATLAMLYAQQYPQNVSGVILRGTFLARHCDLDWFTNEKSHNVQNIFPDYWDEYINSFAKNNNNRLDTLHEEIFSNSYARQLKAAKAWSLWVGRVVTHNLNLTEGYQLDLNNAEDELELINTVKIEAHYAKNNYFINENQILDNISKIPDVPITIIHGRKDLTCLPESSWSVYQSLLHSGLLNSKLIFVPDVGHLGSEPSMVDVLITTTDEMANNIS